MSNIQVPAARSKSLLEISNVACSIVSALPSGAMMPTANGTFASAKKSTSSPGNLAALSAPVAKKRRLSDQSPLAFSNVGWNEWLALVASENEENIRAFVNRFEEPRVINSEAVVPKKESSTSVAAVHSGTSSSRKRRHSDDVDVSPRHILSARRGRFNVSRESVEEVSNNNANTFCRFCCRNCGCAPVEQPLNVEPVVTPVVPEVSVRSQRTRRTVPRRRRAPKAQKNEWDSFVGIQDFSNIDLPDAPATVVNNVFVVKDQQLLASKQEQIVTGANFTAARYDNGIVVLSGVFEGVPLKSSILKKAANVPTVLYNNPVDPVVKIAAGTNHLAMLTRRGHILTVGRADEGQLGASKNPHRFRYSQEVTPESMRRSVGPIRKPLVFSDIETKGNTTIATTIDDEVYRCGEDCSPFFEKIRR